MVPDAYDGQSYNRYTYTGNRPLSFTDTTGNEPDPTPGPCGIGCASPPASTPIETVPVIGERPKAAPVSAELIPYVPGMGVGRWWVNKLTALGAKNISVTPNSNGNLALKFTCSDAKCAAAGRGVNAMFGGTEAFVGGESTGAGANAQGTTGGMQVAAEERSPAEEAYDDLMQEKAEEAKEQEQRDAKGLDPTPAPDANQDSKPEIEYDPISHTFTAIIRGSGEAPKSGQPDAIYEQIDETTGRVRSRTFYNGDGNSVSRQDFDHTHGGMMPHEHLQEFYPNGMPMTPRVTRDLPPGYDDTPTK
jgi:hypothetical protein